MTKTDRSSEADRFVKAHINLDSDQIHQLVAEGTLKLSEVGLFHLMMTRMTPTGRIPIRPTALAEAARISRVTCYKALKTMQIHNLLVRVRDKEAGGSYFLLNPFLVSTGSDKTRGALWAQFKAAIDTSSVG